MIDCDNCGKSIYRYEGDYMICETCGRIHMKTCDECLKETKMLYHGKCISCHTRDKNAK